MAKDCKIIFSNGIKVGVEDNQGNPDPLFNEILSNSHVSSFDEALEIYKNKFSNSIRYVIVGEKGAKNIEELNNKLNQAKELFEQGFSINEIEKTTGWYRNQRSQWKYFSNDFRSQLSFKDGVLNNVNTPQKLEDVIADNTVFDMYPQVKDLNIVFYNSKYEEITENLKNTNGVYDEKQNTLYANMDNTDGKSLERIIGHELNHYIQGVEGFANGGGLYTVLVYALDITNASNVQPKNLVEYLNNIDKTLYSINDLKIIEEAKKSIENFSNKDVEALKEQYYRLQGEIDSRAVELAVQYYQDGVTNDVTYKQLVEQILNIDGIQPSQIIDLISVEAQQQSLKYQTPQGQIYNTFAEALKTIQEGAIKIGLNTVDGFKEFFSVDSNENVNTVGGLLNNLIKENLITGEAYLNVNGETVLKTSGNSQTKKAINSEYVVEALRRKGGIKSARVLQNGDVAINREALERKVEVVNKNGDKEFLLPSEVAQNYKNYEEGLTYLASEEYKKEIPVFGETRQEDKFIPENELQEKLMKLLNKLGIKTLSIVDYVTQYEKRNGVPPSARALADLQNLVIAFKDGVITTEDLTEEVSHFIIASTPNEQLDNLLRNAHKTEEWRQYSEAYMEIYKDEAIVREEILGKVLANTIQKQFIQDVNQSETQRNIVGQLIKVFQDFFNKVASYFSESYQQELNSLTNSVYNNLMQETLAENLETDLLKGRKTSLFSLAVDPLYNKLSETLDLLTSQQNQLAKNKKLNTTREDLRKAKELNQNIDRVSKLLATKNAVLVAKNQIDYLERAVNQAKEGKFPLSQEENAVYATFVNHTVNLLSEIDSLLSKSVKEEADIKKTLADIFVKSKALEGKISVKEDLAIERMVERMAQSYNLSDQAKESVKATIKEAKKDTNFLHAHLGSLIHARNPLLNLAGDVINRMTIQSNQTYLQNVKKFTNTLEKAGVNPTKLKELISEDGKYLISEIDYNALEKEENRIKSESYKEITGKEYKENDLEFENADQRQLYNATIAEKMSEWRESYFTEDFIKQQNQDFQNVPAIALDYYKKNRASIAEIRANATKDGRVILSANDKYEIEQLKKDFNLKLNAYTTSGTIKKGLKEVYNEQTESYEYVTDFNVIRNLDDLELQDVNLVLGLHQINKVMRDRFKDIQDKDFPPAFLEELSKADNPIEFMFLNAYITFPDSYWESLGDNQSIVEKLRAKGSEGLADAIRKQQQIINGILRGNKDMNRPTEVLYSELSKTEKQTIRDASQELENLYMQSKSILKEEETVERISVTSPNESYFEELEDMGMQDNELEFILGHDHITYSSKKKIEEARQFVESYKVGKVVEIPKKFSYIFSEEQDMNEALLSYARTKLLPYFKKTEPQGFTQLMEDLKSGIITPEEFIKSPLVKVSPNFSFYDSVEGRESVVNPRFLENKEAGRPQIKRGYFVNDKYNKYFGIKAGKPTKNLDMWEAYQGLIELQKSTLKSYGVEGNHNLYKLPQVGKRGIRQIMDTMKDKTSRPWKEVLKDMTQFREDEAEFGQDNQGNAASKKMRSNIIPTYYLKDLKDQKDVTDELLYSYALMNQQASLYQARVDNIGDMLSIKQAVLNDEYNGKEASATNTYKMFQSFMDYNIFGVKETFTYQVDVMGHKVDVARVARGFNNFIKKVNLTGLIVPMTSLFQGSVQKRIETIVGERLNQTASSLANKEFLKLSTDAMKETLGLNSKARLNVLGESYGQYNLNERFENSDYNKTVRGFAKSAMATHTLANFPIIPRIILSVLYDNRYFNGNIVNYNQYKRAQKVINPKQTENEIKSSWKQLGLFYDDIVTKDGIQSYDYESIAVKLGKSVGEAQEFVDTFHPALASRVKLAVQDIDSAIPQEEKSLAARHGIASFFLTHRSWLLLATQRRFKNRHLNMASGEYEEGSYLTIAEFITDFVKATRKDGMKSFVSNIKKMWKEADETQRKNMQRVLTDLAFVNGMIVLSTLLSNYLDDEEDPLWALTFADYMLYRTTNEQVSTNLALPKQYTGLIETPIVGIDRLYDMKDYLDVFSGDVIERGAFAGETERWRIIARNTPLLKEYDKLSKMKKTSDTYKYFNKSNTELLPLLYLVKEEE